MKAERCAELRERIRLAAYNNCTAESVPLCETLHLVDALDKAEDDAQKSDCALRLMQHLHIALGKTVAKKDAEIVRLRESLQHVVYQAEVGLADPLVCMLRGIAERGLVPREETP